MKSALLFALIVGVSLPISAQERFVKVNGSGSVDIKSDTATVYSSLLVNGESIVKAAADFKKKSAVVEELFDPMEFRGIEIKFHHPNFSQAQSGIMPPAMAAPGVFVPAAPMLNDVETAFSASATIEFKIKISEDMKPGDLVGIVDKIASELAKAELSLNGGNSLLDFTSSDSKSAENVAIEKAMVDARRRAEVIAMLSNKKLGDVISVESINSFSGAVPVVNYPYNITPYFGSYSRGNSSEKISVSANLVVTFELTD